jgi:hypothetical protein
MPLNLTAGELVEVLSPLEITATLDAEAKLDGIPFMTEMLAFCGRQFRILRRAHRTCTSGGLRELEGTVQLDALRCDGAAHQGCQARCLLLWKERWLRRVEPKTGVTDHDTVANPIDYESASTFLIRSSINEAGLPVCQMTELLSAGCPIRLESRSRYWRQLIYRILSRTITKTELHNSLTLLLGALILHSFTLWARMPWNFSRYQKTPTERLDLKVGEFVEVRRVREILATLDYKARNRGLGFKPEMFGFCGGKYRVLGRVERRIDEDKGCMRELRNDCILLESVSCQGQRSSCARGDYHYWREIWLRRC